MTTGAVGGGIRSGKTRRKLAGAGSMSGPVPALSETEFLRQVLEYAALLGWVGAHFRPALTSRGWRTPVQGPLGAGFPDLVLVHARKKRVMFVELKADAGKLSADQAAVLAVLQEAGAETHVWRPRDWTELEEALR